MGHLIVVIPPEIWRKASQILKDQSKGPFFDIRPNYALFVKKKRSLEVFEQRKKFNL